MAFPCMQTQRRLEQESEMKKKMEIMMREKEKQLDNALANCRQINDSTVHSNEKVLSLEKSVSFNILLFYVA